MATLAIREASPWRGIFSNCGGKIPVDLILELPIEEDRRPTWTFSPSFKAIVRYKASVLWDLSLCCQISRERSLSEQPPTRSEHRDLTLESRSIIQRELGGEGAPQWHQIEFGQSSKSTIFSRYREQPDSVCDIVKTWQAVYQRIESPDGLLSRGSSRRKAVGRCGSTCKLWSM